MLARGPIESFTNAKTAGIIKADGPGGFFIRARTAHVGASRPGIQAIRGQRPFLIDRWINVITNAQRNQWRTYATNNPIQKDSGRIITLRGYTMFIWINSARRLAGLPYSNTRPTSPLPQRAVITSVTPVALNVVLIQFNNSQTWTRNPNAITILADRGIYSATRNKAKQRSRIVTTFPGNPPLGYPGPQLIIRPYNTTPTNATIFATKTIIV